MIFLVYGYSQCKEVSRSLHYLTTMMCMEHKPSNRSMGIIISSLCGDRELGKAMELRNKWNQESTCVLMIVPLEWLISNRGIRTFFTQI